MRIRLQSFLWVALLSVALVSMLSSGSFAGPTDTTTVKGTITQLTKNLITIRSGDKDVEVMLDSKKTVTSGLPEVDKQATVWYKKGTDGNLWAVKVVVPQEAKPNANANPGEAAAGKVAGQIASFNKDRITLRSEGKEFIFMMDGKNTTTVGTPAVDATATVWFKKFKGNMWATKIQVQK